MNRDTTPQFFRAASLDLVAGNLRGRLLGAYPMSPNKRQLQNTLTAAERLREDLARAIADRPGRGL